MKFEIGQTAWHATWSTRELSVTCPDCGGTGRLRVIFHDETQVSIGCANCAAGYDPPTGRVRIYERRPRAESVYINGVEIGSSGTRWRLGHSDNCYQIADESELFADEAECLAHATVKAMAAGAEELARINNKEKDTRSWAWNASYHRKQIKEAERQIGYHTAKLAVAAIKAKEPVSA